MQEVDSYPGVSPRQGSWRQLPVPSPPIGLSTGILECDRIAAQLNHRPRRSAAFPNLLHALISTIQGDNRLWCELPVKKVKNFECNAGFFVGKGETIPNFDTWMNQVAVFTN